MCSCEAFLSRSSKAFQSVFGHENLAGLASDIALVGEPSCVGDDGDEMDEKDNETGTRRLFERRLIHYHPILVCVAVKPYVLSR